MATFQAQVEGITDLTIGTNPTTAELTQFLHDGYQEVLSKIISLNPESIVDFIRESSEQTSNNSLDLNGAKIISVVRESGTDNDWRDCRVVIPALQSRVTDVNSVHYASKYNPAYTLVNDGKVSVFPEPGANPNSFKVYYANTQPLNGSGASLLHSHDDLGYFPETKKYLVVLYAAIKSLSRAMAATSSNLVPEDLQSIVLEQFEGSFPVLDSKVISSVPSVPNDISVSFTETAPAYNTPSLVLAAKPVIADLSISINVPVPPAVLTNSANFTASVPQYAQPLISPDFADADSNWITAEEDPEMSAAKVNVINSELNKYQADIQNNLNAFNKQVTEYQAELQVALQDASVSEQGKLNKYSAEIQSYSAEVNKELQIYTQNVTKETGLWSTEINAQLQKYATDVQDELNNFNKANTVYQASLQVALQDATLSQTKDSLLIQKYTSDIQQYNADISQVIQRYATELQGYTAKISKSSAINQDLIAKYNADIQKNLQKVQQAQLEYTWMEGRMLKLQQEYDGAFIVMAPQAKQE